MKVLSLLLLLAGWFLVVTAIALLQRSFIPAFVVAGTAVEILGLVLLARQHVQEAAKTARHQEPRY